MARYALKKHVGNDFVVVETYEGDAASHNSNISAAKMSDPHGSYIIEELHTDPTIANIKPKRKAKGDA